MDRGRGCWSQRSMSTRRSLCTGLVALACALAAPARAAAQDDAPAAYRSAVTDALREFEAQNYLEARALFLHAHALLPNARTLRGVGAVAFELRRYAETVVYLDAALASDEKPLSGALRSESERLRERARAYVAELHFTVTPDDATVLVDGEPFTEAHAPVWLDIGKHTLAFDAEGYRAEQRSFETEGGERTMWQIALEPLAAASPTPARPEGARIGDLTTNAPAVRNDEQSGGRRRRLSRVGGVLLAGAGSAALGLSAWRFQAHVADGRAVRSRGPEAIGTQDEWLTSRSPPLVLVGVGAGLLTASGALVAPLVPQRTRRWLSPLLLAAGAGALATGLRFIAQGERCDPPSGAALRECVLADEQRERGILVAIVSAPLLTLPTLHTIDWLRGR
jgi:hypothetical protein